MPFNEIWNNLIDKTNGHTPQYKENGLETEVYGTIYKITISMILRDKFGAKDPLIRNSKNRSLSFNVDEIKKHHENYIKYQSPTKIDCHSISNSDSNDSYDSNREDLFDKNFSSNELNNKYENSNDVQQNNNNTSMNENMVVDNKKEIFRCYYNCEGQFTTEQEYVKHCVMTHDNKPAFPSLVDIEKHGLKPQGKRWETSPLS